MIGRELFVYEPFNNNCSAHFAAHFTHLTITALPPSDSVALLFLATIISLIRYLFFVLFIFDLFKGTCSYYVRRVYSVGKPMGINSGWLRHVRAIQLGLAVQSYLTSG